MSQRSISRNEIIANDPRYYRMQGQIATLRVPGKCLLQLLEERNRTAG
jgi:hypothetical protein